MAGLAGLLGGYGSDDEEDEQQEEGDLPLLAGILGGAAAPGSPAQPGAGDASAAASPSQQQQQQPVRVLDGPSTNPEPPPEGLSPPRAAVHDADSDVDSGAAGGPAGPLHMLPPELREPPPGEPHPTIQGNVADFLHKQRCGIGTVMEHMRRNRTWHNPRFLRRMTDHFGLAEYGSNLDPSVWSPEGLPEQDRWEGLRQQLAARKRQRGGEVKFHSAGHQQQQQQQQQPGAATALHAHPQQQQQQQPAGAGGLPPLPAAAVAAAAAAAAAGGLATHPGMAGTAPKVVTIDPRAAAAHAQALAASLAGGGAPAAKKSKWDK